MLLSDGAEFLPKSRQDPEKDRKGNELKWLLCGRVGLKLTKSGIIMKAQTYPSALCWNNHLYVFLNYLML